MTHKAKQQHNIQFHATLPSISAALLPGLLIEKLG
jgi:hypothetical protein